MKQKLLLFYLLWCVFCPASGLFAQSSSTLFDDRLISEIYLSLPPDSLRYMLDQKINDRYLQADLVFVSGNTVRDTVQNVGLRLRGNTSLNAKKKSFKVSFNEFVPGRKYQGVKKLNLRGSANDPSMIREKLFYEVWNKAGMAKRRAAFTKLYINGDYRGLYTNIEEIDKEWLKDVFKNDTGNLYKCTWPADMAYLGDNAADYKKILNNPDTRAYDLTTNETADDYTRLIALFKALNEPVDAAYPGKINSILNTDAVLKAFALDVATGHWDDYFYNKNNYYLYDHPGTGRFEYITFDTDNTFGVSWGNTDWAKRNALLWYRTGEARPLATKLLAVPLFKDRFVRYLDTITRQITLPDSIFPRINALRSLLTPAAADDVFRTLDYGYTMDDFYNAFEKTVDTHTPYGIKPFLITRYLNTTNQIKSLLTAVESPGAGAPQALVQVYPNPAFEQITFRTTGGITGTLLNTLYDMAGRSIASWQWEATEAGHSYSIKNLPPGRYVVRWSAQSAAGTVIFVKYRE